MSQTSPEGKMKKGRGLTFAEKQLKKHGWEKGKGLGKQENGISEAIKVKVKSDTAGVGHHSGEQFTFHWWDHLFNASAANLAVEAGKDGGVRVKKVSKQEGRVTNKKPRRAHENKDMLYGCFVKAATLKSGGEEPLKPDPSSGSSSDEDEKLDLSTARRLTDEELVQACGGRTAHKGARHGLTMSAKLARLEEQEKAFLAAHPQEPKSKPADGGSGGGSGGRGMGSLPREQKVAKRRLVNPTSNKALGEEEGAPGDPGEKRKKKKKKKKKKRRKWQEEEGGSETEAAGQREEGRWAEGPGRSQRAKRETK